MTASAEGVAATRLAFEVGAVGHCNLHRHTCIMNHRELHARAQNYFVGAWKVKLTGHDLHAQVLIHASRNNAFCCGRSSMSCVRTVRR